MSKQDQSHTFLYVDFVEPDPYVLEKAGERDRSGAIEHGKVPSDVSQPFKLLVAACPLAFENLRELFV